MLLRASRLDGLSIQARDGQIGSVSDVWFEDDTWRVRWLVVDTGSWLTGREVLLPTSHLGPLDVGASAVPVDLTKRDVEESPGSGTDLPVSRQMETSIYSHYGWAPYWPVGAAGAYVPPLAFTAPPPVSPEFPGRTDAERDAGDPHLRSASEVIGYYIQGRDDEMGHLYELLLDGHDWVVRYLIVDTGNWWPGKKVLLAPDWIEGIVWAEHIVRVGRTRQQIKEAPDYDPSRWIESNHERLESRQYKSAS